MENFKQVCVWEATILGPERIDEFVRWGMDTFGVRFHFLEEVKTLPDENGPGGRNDLIFAIHNEDVGKFAIPRLSYGIRWIDDVFLNGHGRLYPSHFKNYLSWKEVHRLRDKSLEELTNVQ